MGIIKEENWTGNAEALAKLVKFWLRKKDIGDKSFEPNERLVRDYVAKNILSRPERSGKEAIYGFKQLIQFIACRAMIEDGWPLSKISEDFQKYNNLYLEVIKKSKEWASNNNMMYVVGANNEKDITKIIIY